MSIVRRGNYKVAVPSNLGLSSTISAELDYAATQFTSKNVLTRKTPFEVTPDATGFGLETFDHCLSQFDIGEPFNSMYRPSMIREGLSFSLKCYVPDAYSGALGLIGFSSTIDHNLCDHHRPDPKRIYLWLRRAWTMFIMHELDESIEILGEKVFDPHRN